MIRATLVVILGMALNASAEERLVPQEYPTLQSAVDASNQGDTIKISPGTYTSVDVISNGLTIIGSVNSDGLPITILDAQGEGRHLLCNDQFISVENIQFENSFGATIDAGENVTDVTIRNCIFSSSNNPEPSPQDETLDLISEPDLLSVTIDKCVFYSSEIRICYYVALELSQCEFINTTARFISGRSTSITDVVTFERCNIYLSFEYGREPGDNVQVSNISTNPFDEESFLYFSFGSAQGTACSNYCYPIRINNISGNARVRLGASSTESYFYEMDSCNLFNVDHKYEDSVLLIENGSNTLISNTTISNNISSISGIYNPSITPFTLVNSVVCGNTPTNINGPYDPANSFVLPNCGSFTGACCTSDQCLTRTEIECIQEGGIWLGSNSDCNSVSCAPPDPYGVCCINQQPLGLFLSDCLRVGGDFLGFGSPKDFECPKGCAEDINIDGEVGLPDLIALLSNWGPCPG